jgi:hypothetical protein
MRLKASPKVVPVLCLFVPTQNYAIARKPLILNGGDDGTRTRGLCRDRAAF